MIAETIDHATLSRLVEVGAVCSARVVGQEGGWAVMIKYGMVERALATQRSRQVRLFKRMKTLVSYLKEVGISRFDVDAAHYAPETVKTHSRPDRADALPRAHEATAHDKWFRDQVEIAVNEADDPNTVWVSNEDAKKESAKQRVELTARIAAADRA